MKRKHHRPTLQDGFTLIETILYIGIISIFLYSAVIFAFNFISIRTKSNVAQEVNDNLRLAMDRISFEIRNATALNSLTTTSLSIGVSDPADSPTIISLINGRIYIKLGVADSLPLTSDLVNISNLTFTNLSAGDTKSININYSITGNYINPSGRSEYNKTLNYSGSTEMRSK